MCEYELRSGELTSAGAAERVKAEYDFTAERCSLCRRVPQSKASNAERRRVKDLSERPTDRGAAVAKRGAQSVMEYRKEKPSEIAARKGLKPLRLVADRQANRVSMPMPTSMSVEQKVKKFEVLMEGETASKVSLIGKGAKGKENERGGKLSSSSAVSGPRGLRV